MIGFVIAFFFALDLSAFMPCAPGLVVEYSSGLSETVEGFVHPTEKRLCVIARSDGMRYGREHLADRTSYAGEIERLVALRPPMLKEPLYTGARWRFDRSTMVIVGVGRPITVPAGTFTKTIWVEETLEDFPEKTLSIYAAGVGLVRHVRGESTMDAVRVVGPQAP